VSATDLLQDYWYLMPFAIALDALIWLLAGYGVWRALRHYVTRNDRKKESFCQPPRSDGKRNALWRFAAGEFDFGEPQDAEKES
jgi:hypothetical protein